MPWCIKCQQGNCEGQNARNILDLIDNCRDKDGFLLALARGGHGYIIRAHNLEEGCHANFLLKRVLIVDEGPRKSEHIFRSFSF